MLLTITNNTKPATDLGFLLHKHPSKIQSFPMSFGSANVFYPYASEEQCMVALLLEVDPVKLVRGNHTKSGNQGMLDQYVNDRPYTISSFMSVAIANCFGTALSGKEKEHPLLATKSMDLAVRMPVLPCKGGDSILNRLFTPLGYKIKAQPHLLDSKFTQWGKSEYYTVELHYFGLLSELLSHLYVLIPVLDDEKHYWVAEDEVSKLLRHGGKWFEQHPERQLIAARYLKHQKKLVRDVLARLVDEDNSDPEQKAELFGKEEYELEKRISLNEQRLFSVINVLKDCGMQKLIDLGCGEGRLLKELLPDRYFTRITGLDVSFRTLQIAKKRLQLEQYAPPVRNRLNLIHGSLLYRDKRLIGYDAAVVMEVIEHLDPARLAVFERNLFEFARPKAVIITTPNIEYNIKFENLPAQKLRHKDHRFEWTREEFQTWAKHIAIQFGYKVNFKPIGNEDQLVGAPTQMGIFTL